MLALAALGGGALPATAAAGGWTCEASALRASVLGAEPIEPVTANSGAGPCKNVTSTLDSGLPAALGTGSVAAGTSVIGTDPATGQTVQAVGGIADLKAGTVDALGLEVPQVEIPDALKKVTLDLSALNTALPDQLGVGQVIQLPQLPQLPQIPGLPVLGRSTAIPVVDDVTGQIPGAGETIDSVIDGVVDALPEIPGAEVPELPPVPVDVPELPVQLPDVPLPQLPPITVPDLPTDPSQIVNVPALPTKIEIDLEEALETLRGDLRKLPALELINLKAALASVKGSCVNGQPELTGSHNLAGLSVLGQELPTDQATARTVSLLDGGKLVPSQIDVSKVPLPAELNVVLAQLDQLGLGALRQQIDALVQGAVAQVLAQFPELPVPGALATIQVAPGAQERSEGRLTQTALSVRVGVLGQRVLDLAIGRASVGANDIRCTRSTTAPTQPSNPTGRPTTSEGDIAGDVADEPAALRCTSRRIVLTDVLRSGGKVRLKGAADKRYAGRTVTIVFAGRTKAATAKVGRDGLFTATAPLPPAGLRDTNRARYQARVGNERSLDLKLSRRMVVESVKRSGKKVVITGRITGPLASPVAAIKVQRRVSCARYVDSGTIRPSENGRFRAVLDAPPSGEAAVYRLGTRVRKTLTNPKTFPTFTLPQNVETAS
jgi:hypothetical protein